MKKFSHLALSALLISALLLSGCGSNPSTPADPSAPTSEQTSEQTTAPTQAATSSDDLAPVVLGVVNGNVYENQYLGIGCDFPDNWKLSSAEELQDLPDAIADILADTELNADIPQIMDFYALDAEQSTTVNVLYTETSAAERLSFLLMDEEDMIDSLLTQKDMLKRSYSQMGMEPISMEKATTTFLGEEHFVLKTLCSVEGMEIYITQFFSYDLGGKYYATTTFSGLSEEAVQGAMDLFYALK